MSMSKIGHGEWIVVCDGRKALVVENIGDHISPNLRTVNVREHQNASTHEQGTDGPGRVHASVGTARSSVEQTDWHDEAERHFLHDVARYLDAAIRAGKTKALTVVAPPRALGMLREAYTVLIRDALRQEVDKDLVKMPINEMERRLFS
jgi:protein required for attachment to host cells